jgi:hypothetical protein
VEESDRGKEDTKKKIGTVITYFYVYFLFGKKRQVEMKKLQEREIKIVIQKVYLVLSGVSSKPKTRRQHSCLISAFLS